MNSMEQADRLLREGRYAKALHILHRFEPTEEQRVERDYHIGLCYMRMASYEAARPYFLQVLEAVPGALLLFQSHMILGYIYTKLADLRRAAQQFSSLLDSGFESKRVCTALAHILYMQGEHESSVRLLRRALGWDPNYAPALNSLGYILSDSNIQIEEGLEYCRRALQQAPNNAAYLDSLGWAYYRLGQQRFARHYLDQAIKIAPHSALINAHRQTLSEAAEMDNA